MTVYVICTCMYQQISRLYLISSNREVYLLLLWTWCCRSVKQTICFLSQSEWPYVLGMGAGVRAVTSLHVGIPLDITYTTGRGHPSRWLLWLRPDTATCRAVWPAGSTACVCVVAAVCGLARLVLCFADLVFTLLLVALPLVDSLLE